MCCSCRPQRELFFCTLSQALAAALVAAQYARARAALNRAELGRPNAAFFAAAEPPGIGARCVRTATRCSSRARRSVTCRTAAGTFTRGPPSACDIATAEVRRREFTRDGADRKWWPSPYARWAAISARRRSGPAGRASRSQCGTSFARCRANSREFARWSSAARARRRGVLHADRRRAGDRGESRKVRSGWLQAREPNRHQMKNARVTWTTTGLVDLRDERHLRRRRCNAFLRRN